MKYLVGLDLGFAKMGASIFEAAPEIGGLKLIDAKVLRTEKGKSSGKMTTAGTVRVDTDIINRVVQMNHMLKDFIVLNISEIDFKIFIAGECPHGGSQSSTASRAEGLCIAQVVTFCWCNGLIFEQVTPDEVKRVATGRRQSVSKLDVQQGLNKKFGVCDVFKNSEKDIHSEDFVQYLDGCNKTDREDIADSIAAGTHVVENSNMYKAFLA